MKTALLLSALIAMPVMAQQVQQQAPATALKQHEMVTLKNNNQALQNATVIRQLAAGKAGHIDLVKTQDGRIAKRLTRANDRISAPRQVVSAKAAEGASLYEDFSGWDGETKNWIPEGWTDIESQDPTVQQDPDSYTWHVEQNSVGFFADPEHGSYQASIYLALDYETYAYGVNDDWLISPEFVPAEGENIQYSLSFTPFWMLDANYIDWDTFEFTDRVRTASVQTYLKVDGGEWTLVYDPFDDWKDATMDELMEGGLENPWRTYTIDATELAGKTVQIAFRYEGVNGENWSIDFASCALAVPEASYIRPAGAFLYGYSKEYSSLAVDDQTLLLLPGNTDVTWYNNSNADATSFSWSYDYMANTTEFGTSTEPNLTVSYEALADQEYNWYYVPELTAYANNGTSSVYSAPFYCLQAGGYPHYTFNDGSTYKYGAANYNVANKFSSLFYDANTPLYGVAEGVDAAWSELFGADVEMIAVGNMFEKPTVPYQLHGLNILCGTEEELTTDAEISLSLIRVSGGYLADTLAISTCTGANAELAQEYSGTYYYSLPFTFVVEEDGFYSEADLTIDDDIIAFLDIKSAKNINMLELWHSYYPDANEETNGCFMVGLEGGVRKVYPMSVLSTSQGPCYSSFLFNLDVTYPIEDTKVAAISNDRAAARCYNLAGQQVKQGAKGFVIEQTADGAVKKVIK